MAVKTKDLYSSIWDACDALRGSVDISEYKNFILPLVFIKYATDKHLNKPYEKITIYDKAHDPALDPDQRTGCSFNDMIELKNQRGIGEGIDKIFTKLAAENPDCGLDAVPQYNDASKTGVGKEQIDKLTDLIKIFQRPELDFSKNTAEADDILGDVFEYLMSRFAAEAGKSKGQFYTPDGASRVLAHVSGIPKCKNRSATIYDPACGSASLLMRTADAAPDTIDGLPYNPVAYGQEKDGSTSSLAKMNALIHGYEMNIHTGNTLAAPYPLNQDGSGVRQYDYVVCNPPYSLKKWTQGLIPDSPLYNRFRYYGFMPPEGNGDYAWLLHCLASMKEDGHGSMVLPLGILFRGGVEKSLRQKIVENGCITSVIAMPANLFYGTGIPVTIISLAKGEDAQTGGILFIDASTMFVKDKDKNRLREQDIKKICDLWDTNGQCDPRYARFVSLNEIRANDFNLNVSLYIEPIEKPVIEDIEGHLHGGIPANDLDRLSDYFDAFDGIRQELLEEIDPINRPGYFTIKETPKNLREMIETDFRVQQHSQMFSDAIEKWKDHIIPILEDLPNCGPEKNAKSLRKDIGLITMDDFSDIPVIDPYDAYQVFMAYWQDVLKDDMAPIIGHFDEQGNLVGNNGFEIAKETEHNGKKWNGAYLPKDIVERVKFPAEVIELENIDNELSLLSSQIEELVAETREDSMLSELIGDDGKVPNKKTVDDFIAEKRGILTSPEIEALEEFHQQLAEKVLTSAKEKKDWLAAHLQAAGALGDVKPNKNDVAKHIRGLRSAMSFDTDEENADIKELEKLSSLLAKQKIVNDERKQVAAQLDELAVQFFENATEEELRALMVESKWLADLETGLKEVEKISIQEFTTRLDDLATRYHSSLVEMRRDVRAAEEKVIKDLARLGIVW